MLDTLRDDPELKDDRSPESLLAALRQAGGDDEVERILAHHRGALERLARGAGFDVASYRREELIRDDGLLVVLIGWLPGQASLPHDHGGSACIYRVLRGIAEERRFELLPSGEVRVEAVERFAADANIRCDGEDIHSLGNPVDATSPLVTLHVYRPAPAMRFHPIAAGGDA